MILRCEKVLTLKNARFGHGCVGRQGRQNTRPVKRSPTRCKRGAIGGKRSVLMAVRCLQIVRYQDGSAVAGDCDRVSVGRSGEQRRTVSDYIDNAADVELAIVDRSQVVGDAWLWRCDLAVGQVIRL